MPLMDFNVLSFSAPGSRGEHSMMNICINNHYAFCFFRCLVQILKVPPGIPKILFFSSADCP